MKFFIKIFLFSFIHLKCYKPMIYELKTPFSHSIQVEIVSKTERKRLIEDKGTIVYKILRDFLGENIVYRLEDSCLLMTYTADAYSLKFKSEQDLKLFMHNDKHPTASLIIKDNKLYYAYRLFATSTPELLNRSVEEIDMYPSRGAHKQKLYRLDDGTYLRAAKRAPDIDIWDGSWYATLDNFLWYYKNDFED